MVARFALNSPVVIDQNTCDNGYVDATEALRTAARGLVEHLLDEDSRTGRLRTPRTRDRPLDDVDESSIELFCEASSVLHPRFQDSIAFEHRDHSRFYANTLVRNFKSACRDQSFAHLSTEELVELMANSAVEAITSESREIASIHVVEHLETVGNVAINIEGVEIDSVTDASFYVDELILESIDRVIPLASAELNHEFIPIPESPVSVLSIREGHTGLGFDWDQLTNRLARLEVLIRLTTGGTLRPVYGIRGNTGLVGPYYSEVTPYRGDFGFAPITRSLKRKSVVSNEMSAFITSLGGLLDQALKPKEGAIATPMPIAIQRFQAAPHGYTWYGQFLDLAIGFEAIFGSGNGGVTYRLSNRAAVLLSNKSDIASTIFSDVGHLYHLRSVIVHGAEQDRKNIEKILDKISTVPHDVRLDEKVSLAVDRLQDLLRRAIIARLVLEYGPKPMWVASKNIDAILSDTRSQEEWRSNWNEWCKEFGWATASNRVESGVDSLSNRRYY